MVSPNWQILLSLIYRAEIGKFQFMAAERAKQLAVIAFLADTLTHTHTHTHTHHVHTTYTHTVSCPTPHRRKCVGVTSLYHGC